MTVITHSLFSCSRLNHDQAFQTFTLDPKGKTLSCPFEIEVLIGNIAVIGPLFMFFVAFPHYLHTLWFMDGKTEGEGEDQTQGEEPYFE